MKKIINLSFAAMLLLVATMAHSQTLDYLKPLGNQLAEDIINQTNNALIKKDAMSIYLKKAILPGLNQQFSEAEKEQAVNTGIMNSSEAYQDAVSQLNSFLDKAKMNKDEFSLWANVPLKVEVHESQSNGAFSAPDSSKDNLSTLTVHFLLGDFVSRIILPATVIGLNGEFFIMKLESPLSYYQFMDGDYGTIYQNMYSLIEKQLEGDKNSVSRLVSGSPLIGERYDQDWYKCTVQLVGNNPPTLARTLSSGDGPFTMKISTQVKVKLFDHIKASEAVTYLYDLLSVFAQEFNIESANQKIKVNTYQALSENKETGAMEASLQLKKGSGDRILFELKLLLTENADKTANLELWLDKNG